MKRVRRNYGPRIWQLKKLIESVKGCDAQINGKWVPARALLYPSIWQRLRAAWLVFKGAADAVIWPEGQ